MSNVSLKEQLQALASQLSEPVGKEQRPKKKLGQVEKAKKPKPRWLDYVQYGVELLRVYFPASFKSGNEVRPLKKGIKQDLIKRLSSIEHIVIEDKACMVKSLAYYVNTSAYHKSVIEGAMRIDLDGNPTGVVSAEEAKYSIDRHHAKLQAKREAAVAPNAPAQNKTKVEVAQ